MSRIYVCHTFYHVYVSILKEMKLEREDTAYEKGDKQRGVGLGLTICKAIVEAQGGTITAYNGSQGGAVFEIRMPLEDKKHE